ncbi:adenosylcobalamin-dependent ribonucleoside-diphosphate reductase [Candidatus Woesearchaeota archaeon]|nr:adenosylcobalamin-dependent ribonucleoside-diphosphate reductase [Candidatus Woesearchaeota archaeon]
MVNATLEVKKYFAGNGKEPHENFAWETRDVEAKDVTGKQIYNIKGAEFPSTWSTLAGRTVATKYFYKGDGKEYEEKSLKDLVYRVARSISAQGVERGYLSEEDGRRFQDEIARMNFDQMHSFNSPVWFNVGLDHAYGVTSNAKSHWAIDDDGGYSIVDAYNRPQASACFIQSVKDCMEDLMDHGKREGMLFKLGSGTGTNFSVIRGMFEPLSGGGMASGSISFKKIFDILAGTIMAAGKTRRAAKMVILDCDHPDVYRFLHWKVSEEKKGLWLSANPRWGPLDPTDLESEAYKTISGQNGNNSIRVTDKFMEAALGNRSWDLVKRTANRFEEEIEVPLEDYQDDRCLPDKRFLKRVTNKRKTVNAKELLEQIARAAACIGDPGVQYDDNINRWHTCPNSGKINASNPCSEFMFIDDSACNLASLNLARFSKTDNVLDIEAFEQAVRTSVIAQDILVDYASYPSEVIARNSHMFRPLGLGYANIGALLMERGIAYDSEEGRAIASAVTSLMTAYAYLTSAELAEKLGAFEEFEKNKEPMLKVLGMHHEETKKIKRFNSISGLNELIEEAERIWEEAIQKGQEHGFRNAQTTLLAPTGTIGFMMDVDCTGIEPLIGLKSFKGYAGGGSAEIPLASCVERGLKCLGYEGEKLSAILKHIRENGTVVGAPNLREEHYRIFATASEKENYIPVDGHLNMMAAVQPFLSGAISKTVNLPKGATPEDIMNTYIKAWKLGIKSVTPYIDGSKGIQPVNIITKTEGNGLKWGDRDRLAELNTPRTGYKVVINGTTVHFTFGEYDNRPPKESFGDIFIDFGSSGSPFSAAYESWAKEVSRARQMGASMENIIKHNKGATGVISGFAKHPFIKSCSSIEDMFAKLLMLEYLGDTSICDVQPTPAQMKNLRCNVLGLERRIQHFSSKIEFIETIMEEGKVTGVFPLYEDSTEKGKIPLGQEFCIICGHKTVLSGANCRKCVNCGHAPGCG